MRLSKTQRIAAISLCATALILFFVFRPSPLLVDSGEVSRGALQVTLDAEGVTRVNDRFVVAAPVTGRLMRVALKEGDTVNKGGVLATLLPPELDARQYQEASARSESARATLNEALARADRTDLSLAEAERRARRYRNLHGEGAISSESFEVAENEAGVLRKEAEAARSAVASARYTFQALQTLVDSRSSHRAVTLLAPVEGRVLRIHEQSERTVAAGSPLIDIGDPSSIEIVIDLLSSDAVKVSPGNRVVILDWGGERELQGRVKTIEPSAFTKVSALGIEEKRINVIAVLDNYEPLLGDNFRVQAKIILHEAPNLLQVPVSSLFRGKNGWNLFVIEGGRAIQKRVTIGLRGSYQAELLSGAAVGQKVIVHPTNELENGMRVKIRE